MKSTDVSARAPKPAPPARKGPPIDTPESVRPPVQPPRQEEKIDFGDTFLPGPEAEKEERADFVTRKVQQQTALPKRLELRKKKKPSEAPPTPPNMTPPMDIFSTPRAPSATPLSLKGAGKKATAVSVFGGEIPDVESMLNQFLDKLRHQAKKR